MSAKVKSAEVVIVGGGIAGLSVAWQLTALGVRDVVLLEADELLASHSSARNAAIHMQLEESLAAITLAQRSRSMIDEQLGTSWLDANGVVYVTEDPEALDELRHWADQGEVFCESWRPRQLLSRVPLLDDSKDYASLALPLSGVMDVHRVLEFIAHRARRGGARLLTHSAVTEIEAREGCVRACVLADGQRIATRHVVLACGAWAGQMGAQLGCPLPLTPLRRHLAQLSGPGLYHPRMPVVWRLDDAVYFRPESGGMLASPCDETPHVAELPPSDPGVLESLALKLAGVSEHFAEAGIQRAWACLRTMAEDRESVVGADPRLRGLFWHAGLGGRGMTVGPATGQLVAKAILGSDDPLLAPLSPARLL